MSANRVVQLTAVSILLTTRLGVAQETVRASLPDSSIGGEANAPSNFPRISDDSRYIVFASSASNLVTGDNNNFADVFLRDRVTGSTSILSSNAGTLGNNNSFGPVDISADNSRVVFQSWASNLLGTGIDTNGCSDIFVRTLQSGTIERVSVFSTNSQSNNNSWLNGLGHTTSTDGRYVVFTSDATNLVAGDTNGFSDVFVRDRATLTTICVSRASGANGTIGDSQSMNGVISSDGRYVAFESDADNLVSVDTNQFRDIFVRDLLNNTTTLVTNWNDDSVSPVLSDAAGDGTFVVAYQSYATNVIPNDGNNSWDVFAQVLPITASPDLVSQSSTGSQGNSHSYCQSISRDGRFVAFITQSTNLTLGDSGVYNLYLRDRQRGLAVRVDLATNLDEANAATDSCGVTSDGRMVAFSSGATNLVPNDGNNSEDVFVHDMNDSGFSSTCEPGVGSVRTCPCSNPGSAGTGCNNHDGTGGARVIATGFARISHDTLVLSTTGEDDHATSVVWETPVFNLPNGAQYFHGVKCTGAAIRLYDAVAVGGSISVPQGGDPSVTALSSDKGFPIVAGQTRWFWVTYRDQSFGSCTATSEVNTTQMAAVAWVP